MAKFVRVWNTVTSRQEAVSVLKGLEIVGKELRAKGDGQAITIDSVSGITIIATGLEDRFLAQITTANKVAGSAVQLASNGGVEDSTGLKIKINADMFSLGVSGLSFDYNTSHFQFIPGTGLVLNAVPDANLSSNIMYVDGTRSFTQPVGGIDAVSSSQLTTLGQVNLLISNALSGDFSEILLNLAGRAVIKGEVGYVEGVSGSFRLAKADSPATAIVQYACVANSVSDGASGQFQNPSVEVNDVTNIVSGFSPGGTLWLSATQAGKFQTTPPTVSGFSILDCGWVKNTVNGYVLFPKEAIDL
jgi:hypothetical protein